MQLLAMDQENQRNVTIYYDAIPVADPRFFVSRPCRDAWFRDDGQLETLLFSDSGVYVLNAEENALGPRLELWQRDTHCDSDRQPYDLSFSWESGSSAVWDPWSERVLFSCGDSKVLCLDASNQVSLLMDFAQAPGPAPSACNFLALDPQQRDRLWVVTAAADGCFDDDGGGEVYEINLRSSSSAPSSSPCSAPARMYRSETTAPGPSASQPLPASPVAHVRRVARLPEKPNGAAFDAPRRRLLLATDSAISALPVDRRQQAGGDADADVDVDDENDDCVEPELLVGYDDTTCLHGVTGLTCAADGSPYLHLVESANFRSVRRRAHMPLSTVRRLDLGSASSGGGGGGGGAEGSGGGGGVALVTLATADRARWCSPHVLPDGRLALVDKGREVLLLNLPHPPPLPPQPQPRGRPTSGACGRSGGGHNQPARRRTLASDLGALLDSCQGPGGGGGGGGGGADVTLVAAGGVELKAHSAILMARCDYFRPLLGEGGGFGDSGSRRVSLPEVDAGTLRCVLRHIYTGETVDLEPLLDPPPPPPPPSLSHHHQQHQQQHQQQQGLRATGSDAPAGAGGDPLLALAEASDRLLLPQLCRAAQAGVLRRCVSAPARHLVPDLLWAAAHGGFGRLVSELKELYVAHAEELRAAEAEAEGAAREARRRGHRHRHGDGGGGGGGAGGSVAGPRQLATSNPELGAELEGEVEARKRRRRD